MSTGVSLREFLEFVYHGEEFYVRTLTVPLRSNMASLRLLEDIGLGNPRERCLSPELASDRQLRRKIRDLLEMLPCDVHEDPLPARLYRLENVYLPRMIAFRVGTDRMIAIDMVSGWQVAGIDVPHFVVAPEYAEALGEYANTVRAFVVDAYSGNNKKLGRDARRRLREYIDRNNGVDQWHFQFEQGMTAIIAQAKTRYAYV